MDNPTPEAVGELVEVSQADRDEFARLVEGDSDNPLRVAEANRIYAGLRDDAVRQHLRAALERPHSKEQG